MTVIPDLKTLYEIDDSLWLEETIELLKAKSVQLAAELADLKQKMNSSEEALKFAEMKTQMESKINAAPNRKTSIIFKIRWKTQNK